MTVTFAFVDPVLGSLGANLRPPAPPHFFPSILHTCAISTVPCASTWEYSHTLLMPLLCSITDLGISNSWSYIDPRLGASLPAEMLIDYVRVYQEVSVTLSTVDSYRLSIAFL